jgi:hypothetical protein
MTGPSPDWLARHTTDTGRFSLTHRDTGEVIELPVGVRLIFDWLSYVTGLLQWQPRFDASRMAPRHLSGPPPDDAGDLKGAVQLNLLAQGCELAQLTTSSKTVANQLERLYRGWHAAGEASQSLLTVYTMQQPVRFSLPYRAAPYYRPNLAPLGWVARDRAIFGPATSPPPRPRLAHGAASDRLFDNMTRTGELLPSDDGQ